MKSGLELFYWHRAENGYEWRDGKTLSGLGDLTDEEREETRFLFPRPMDPPRHWRYNPLAKFPALYREFAALEPTEEAFASFADTYGELGIGLPTMESGPFRPHDPLCRWTQSHWHMRPLVNVLNAIQDRDMSAIRGWFTLGSNGAKYQRRDEHGSEWGWVTIADEHREYLWNWAMEAESDDDALLRIAQGWAQDRINKALGDEGKGTLTSARVIFEHEPKRMGLHVTPHSLIGALWLQCARVLTLNPIFKSCEHCGEWFEISPESRRKHSKYCSGRCKVAAYRARQDG